MDVNGIRFWSFSRKEDWFGRGAAPENLYYCSDDRVLRLNAQSKTPLLNEDAILAKKIREAPAPVADNQGNVARWDDIHKAVLPAGDTDLKHAFLAGGLAPSDLAFGSDDILYIARDGQIELVDTRGRWSPKFVSLENFNATKLAPATGGGVFALDTGRGLIAKLVGSPLQEGLFPPEPTAQFAPHVENPDPPQLELLPISPFDHAVGLAASAGGLCAVLCADGTDNARIVVLDGLAVRTTITLMGVKHPVGLAWIGVDEIAVLATDGNSLSQDALVYDLADIASGLPNGRIYRLINSTLESFVNVRAHEPIYLSTDGTLHALIPVSAVTYARDGTVRLTIDSSARDTVWHRIYLEAAIPEGCMIVAGLAATDQIADTLEHFSHVFGGAKTSGVPQGAWLDEPSELPQHPGLLMKARVPNRIGLFSVLVQRPSLNVRRIVGRYLHISLQLTGNSHLTPEVAGLRIYGNRFSYRDQYLPRLYHEDQLLDASLSKASGPDFLERYLSLLEEPMTMIEGKIAESHLLTRASAAPAAALPWLAQWIGIDMAEGEASTKDREILKAAPFTAKLHGTLGGLRAALELETGGTFVENVRLDPNELPARVGEITLAEAGGKAVRGLVLSTSNAVSQTSATMLVGGKVSSGAIIVLEGFRLRRTFATILGANLADDDDELTAGLTISGNSFVGDSLILGAEHNSDVLGLFADTPNPVERKSVLDFFDKLAFRVTVLVNDEATAQDMVRLQRIADAESPAHVEVNIAKARYPFLVGAGSLIGVDTYLAAQPPRQTFRISASQLGTSDLIFNQGLLARTTKGLQQ